jgi:dienelactone hydrolase
VRGGDAIELAAGDSTVRESPFEFEHAGHRLSGVLSEPIGPPSAPICAVLLNTGADRRVGVGRISVEAARRWAAHGIPTLRFDVAGVGDSDGGEGLYAHSADAMQLVELADQVISALDAAEARGLPARFVVGGMCAGAFWGLHAALKDERVRGLMLVNTCSRSRGAIRCTGAARPSALAASAPAEAAGDASRRDIESARSPAVCARR